MAIPTTREFEAIINNIVVHIEKELLERDSPELESAIRDLRDIHEAAGDPTKLRWRSGLLERVTDVLRDELLNDSALLEQLRELRDYADHWIDHEGTCG